MALLVGTEFRKYFGVYGQAKGLHLHSNIEKVIVAFASVNIEIDYNEGVPWNGAVASDLGTIRYD